jgi:hypothetical protein
MNLERQLSSGQLVVLGFPMIQRKPREAEAEPARRATRVLAGS